MHPDQIFAQLSDTFSPEVEDSFVRFLREHNCDRWIIASDFVIGDPTRFYDVFAFTVYPNPPIPYEAWTKGLSLILPRDFKKIKEISQIRLALMKHADNFSFCFMLNREREVNDDKATLLSGIDRTIAMMEAWENAANHQDMIGRFRALRQEAQARKFNVKLLHDTILFTSFNAFIAYLIAKHSNPTLIAAFPDRDKMTTVVRSIWESMFTANFGALGLRYGIENLERINLGVGQRHLFQGREEGETYDAVTRTPDYLAGAMAVWNFRENYVASDHPKARQMIEHVVCDNERVAVVLVQLGADEMSTSRLITRRVSSDARALM